MEICQVKEIVEIVVQGGVIAFVVWAVAVRI